MKKVSLLISPTDVSLFRDPRPFQVGDTSISSDLPLPQVTAGAVRAWLLEYSQVRITEERLEGKEETNEQRLQRLLKTGRLPSWIYEMRLLGPFLANEVGEPWLPSPVNLQGKKNDFDPTLYDNLRLQEPLEDSLPGWGSPHGNMIPVWAPGEPMDPADRWMDEPALAGTLHRVLPDLRTYSRLPLRQELVDFESRLGIGMDSDKNVTREGQIYSAAFLRLNSVKYDVHFRIDLEVDETAEKTIYQAVCDRPWLILGGERRAARVRLIAPHAWTRPRVAWQDDKEMRFTTYLATPGLFDKGGWLPMKMLERGFELVSAVVGKPQPWSPWDSSARCHGKTCYAVPAGAIYFWRKPSDCTAEVPHGTCISDRDENRQAGWGFCMRGAWEYVK